MARPIREQVIVVVGASTGIGRAAALALARKGARVVVAARGERNLAELTGQIAGEGGTAYAVPTDVTDLTQVRHLLEETVNQFGRVDTWVNCAAITVFGTVRNTDVGEFRQLMEVNYMGQVHGVKLALPLMLQQGGGTIILVGSVESKRGIALQAAYSASKAAIVAFAQALRQELHGTPVRVCTVLPSSIDTPFYEHARSKEGYKPRPFPPYYSPEEVAKAIVGCAERPRRTTIVGAAGAALIIADHVVPGLIDVALGRLARRLELSDEPEPPFGHDNFDAPMEVPDPLYGGLRERAPYYGAAALRSYTAIAGFLLLALGLLLRLSVTDRRK
ncbi:MAG: SDR family oxidoreductase [Chloroflexota bacterium]